VQLWLQNQELLTDITETVGQINQELQEIAATVQQVTAGAQQIAQDSQNTYQTANESVNKIQNIEQVLQSIRNIASQSNLIGLNAAIEAARVGEAGRGFTVVANEVRKLATSSEESVKDISAVLEQIREIFMVIVNKVEQNKEVTQEQSSALLSVAQRVQSIEGNMSFLIGKIHE
jgi:methyl-accepting chemotaxis protein